ncbi:amidohydrolase family protein [Candidatus Sumerlaeota bacterium]|nr:amidohydrolase family protein [Candidatus Sumerlaeota bacterium]
MRIDTHQHFIQFAAAPRDYPWIGEGMDCLKADLLPETLAPLLEKSGIDGTIAVQARQTLQETEWLLDLAQKHPFIKGVVGWVDLCSPQARTHLQRLARDPKCVGVRHVVHDEPDDRFMMSKDFLRGLAMLPEFDLAYDLLLFPRHLPVACEVVEQFPGVTFVLDHIAKPPIKTGAIEPWRTDIRRLAQFSNVVCKVSGMVTEADWKNWTQDQFEPYLDVVFEAFGPQRILVGSDWPVCALAGKYRHVVELADGYIQRLPVEYREAIWGGNAHRVYGFPL